MMTRLFLMAAVVTLTLGGAGTLQAQSGDPDRVDRQAALLNAASVENAFQSVERRIRVTDVGNLWTSEWTGLVDPPVGSWWLQSWEDRGLTARYCDGVLAVYAGDDELKGVGRDHRAVQVAPVAYGTGRTGLHLIGRGSRLFTGAHGRGDGSLPACMPVPSTTGDRVGLVSAVADPRLTPVGTRWVNEDRTVSCVSPDTGTKTERRRKPVQVTAVTDCPAGTPNCNDLSEFAAVPAAWPADCATRETMLSATPATLPANSACTDWVLWRSNCQIVYAAAPAPADIPDPTITWETGPVHTWTSSCACPSGQTGTCIRHWAQNTEIRVFVLRPGSPELRKQQPARGSAGRRRLVSTDEHCTPIVVQKPGGGNPGGDPGDGGPGPGDGGPGGPGGGGPGGGGPGGSGPGGGEVGGIGGVDGGQTGGHAPGQSNPDGGDGGDGGGDGGGCFLTTAVVEQRGEADDGPTLTAMRRFRDTYMQATPERRELVEGYYRVAPAIVAAIPKNHPDWAWLEAKIDASASAFRRGENDLAFEIMAGAVHRLHDRWLVDEAGE